MAEDLFAPDIHFNADGSITKISREEIGMQIRRALVLAYDPPGVCVFGCMTRYPRRPFLSKKLGKSHDDLENIPRPRCQSYARLDHGNPVLGVAATGSSEWRDAPGYGQ
jgi:hypothetical protein